ncbi:MAG: hypothetical protein ACAH59_07165 [Pseudobdellovibrionaceae bacterium]
MDNNITNPKIDNAIFRAEQAVENSINKFEAAMEHLAEKAEMTSQKLQHVRDVGRRSKDQLVHLKDEVTSTFEPVMPYVSRARSVSRSAVGEVRRNSRPLFVSALGLLGGYLIYRYFLKERSSGVWLSNQYSAAANNAFSSSGQSADQFSNLSYPR